MTDPKPNKKSTQAGRSPAAGVPPTAVGNASHGKASSWYRPAQAFIDLELPHLNISRELRRGDTSAIWQEYAKAADQPMYLDWLASLAGNYTVQDKHPRYRTRQSTWDHTLAAVPFLIPPQKWPVSAPDLDEMKAAAPLRHQFQTWVGSPLKQEVTAVSTDIRYAEVYRWSPVAQLELLRKLARQPERFVPSLLPAQQRILEGFPELAFVVFGVKRWLVPPELPEPGLGRKNEWELRSQLAARLAYLLHRPVQASDVLAPASFAEAVLEGLRMWIGELSRRKLVSGWQAHPGQDDLALLELFCVNPEFPSIVLPVRGHQVRPAGLDLLLVELRQEFGNPIASQALDA